MIEKMEKVVIIKNTKTDQVKVFEGKKSSINNEFLIMQIVMDDFDSIDDAKKWCFKFNHNVIGVINNDNY